MNTSLEDGGYSVGPEDREIFEKGLKKFYLNQPKYTLEQTYDAIMRESYSAYEYGQKALLPADRRPSRRQFFYYYQKQYARKPSVFIKAKAGARQFEMGQRPIKGNMTHETFGPGDLYEIDATVADVHLVDEFGRPIGRPTVYLVVDVFSHIPAGLCVTLESPSYIGAALALAKAFTDKVAFCASYGITISEDQWPCAHLCSGLKADRGELIFPEADRRLVNKFNISLDNLPPFRPDWKSIIERFFGRFNQRVIHALPGAVAKPKERGERDPRLDSTLTLHAFTKIMILTALSFLLDPLKKYPLDQPMVDAGVVAQPLTLRRWGMSNRTGALRKMSKQMVERTLLPRDKAKITVAGLLYRNVFFTSENEMFSEWQTVAKKKGDISVTIALDPRLADGVFIEPSNGAPLIACTLRQDQELFRGMSWKEVDLHWEDRRAKERAIAEDSERTSAKYKQGINDTLVESKKNAEEVIDPLARKHRV